MLTPSEGTVKAAIANVWPYDENREVLPNGESYCHSGTFYPNKRVTANLTRVTSVFCDIDFVDILKIACPGESISDLKTKLYEMLCSVDDPCHADFMGCASKALVEAISAANLPAPSLVLCSGWGLHVHWALQRDTGEKLAKVVVAKDAAVKQIHTVIDERVSARFPALLRAQMSKSGEWAPEVEAVFLNEAVLAAWGAAGVVDKQARDLGTRLVRYPGTFNTKQPEHIEVHALYASETLLPNWSMLSHAPRAALPAPARDLSAAVSRLQARKAADGKSLLQQMAEADRKVSTPIPFHLTFVKAGDYEGMSLRAIGDEMLPVIEGQEPDPKVKINIVSPWRKGDGGSEGSAFIARERDGRLSVRCNITEERYVDSVDPTLDPERLGTEGHTSPWGNEIAGATLDKDTNKVVDGRATPYLIATNIEKILVGDAHYDTLVFDTFSEGFRMEYPDPDTGEVFSRPISESRLITDLVVHAWSHYDKFYLEGTQARAVCKRALELFSQRQTDEETGRKYRQDWLKEYVLSHKEKWDNVPRLDEWLVRTTGCEDTPLNRLYGRKWMLQLAATGLGIGSAHAILLLRGKQGGGKSSFGHILRWGKRRMLLTPEEKAQPSAYTDRLADPTGSARDMLSSLRTAWIIEDAEALVLGHKHTGAVKSLLTAETVSARAMYGEHDIEVKLRCCLYASGNEDIELSDATGNRRVFGVDVADRMDLDYLRENRDALFGEAVTYLLSDEVQADILRGRSPWMIQLDETVEVGGEQVGVLAVQSEANNKLSEENVWSTIARTAFRSNAGGVKNGFTITQFLLAADDRLSVSTISRAHRIRAGVALKAEGFVKRSVKGSSADVWAAPDSNPQWVGVLQSGNGLALLGSPDHQRKVTNAVLKVVK